MEISLYYVCFTLDNKTLVHKMSQNPTLEQLDTFNPNLIAKSKTEFFFLHLL